MFRELFFVVLLSQNVFAYNILAIVSIPLRSHYMAFRPLFRELAIRGHNVTVMNNFPDTEVAPNLKFIDIEAPALLTLPPMEYYEKISSSLLHLDGYFRHLPRMPAYIKRDCDILLSRDKLKEHMIKYKYDVIFVELFESDCALVYALHMSDAPVIGIKSHVLLPRTYETLGIPFDFSADAYYRSNGGLNPSFQHKVENYVMDLVSTIQTWYIKKVVKQSFEEYIPHKNLDIEKETKERLKMVFAYQHYSVTGARLLAPQLLEIGGLHIGTAKPVPKEIEDILNKTKHGVVYVSFGTNLLPYTMSKDKLQQFLNAFKQLPYTIIWKINNFTLPEGYENIHIGSWWPQLDVLCHPKVLAFVSHGGMLSVTESAHCGKPILTVPFFGDQFSNAAAVRNSGLGKTLYLRDMTADSLTQAVKDLMTEEMQQSAKRVSKLWHDRPQSVMDSAIYWTEYVARHRQAPPALPSTYNTWFERTLIDVYSVLVLILFAVFLILYAVFKIFKFVLMTLYRMIFRGQKSKKE